MSPLLLDLVARLQALRADMGNLSRGRDIPVEHVHRFRLAFDRLTEADALLRSSV